MPSESQPPAPAAGRIPFPLKLAFTAFMAILVPVYWVHYGPTNFLYFCDMALILTLIGLWREHALTLSMAAVGILLLQGLWCIDFFCQMAHIPFLGATGYMFEAQRPLYLRALSLFHGWLPFLLLFLVRRKGYDPRALWYWSGLAWAAMASSYLFLPGPGFTTQRAMNINYVHGLSDAAAQTWMPSWAWLALLFTGLPVLIFLPTHWALKRWAPRPQAA